MKTKKIITNAAFMAASIAVLAGCATTENSATKDENESSNAQISVIEAVADDTEDHDLKNREEDYSEAVIINLEERTSGAGYSWSDSSLTIEEGGVYQIEGTLEGQIVVNTEDEDTTLVLNNANVTSVDSSAILVSEADTVNIVALSGTTNSIGDTASSADESYTNEDDPAAAVYSKADLSFYGSGELTVNGTVGDAIISKDGLVIDEIKLTVVSANDGIQGKDYVIIKSGDIKVSAKNDGIKSTELDTEGRGYVRLEDGTVVIEASGDGIDAAQDYLQSGGTLSIITSGEVEDQSQKGVKAGIAIHIVSGEVSVNSVDDSIHSDGSILIDGGTFSLKSGDDGIHAEKAFTVNNGTINILESVEGIEGEILTFNGGEITINSSDDGINATTGESSNAPENEQSFPTDGESRGAPPENQESFPTDGENRGAPPENQTNADNQPPADFNREERPEGSMPEGSMPEGSMPDRNMAGGPGGGGGGGGGEATDGSSLTFNGSTITITANGDGIDSNGTIEMTKGKVLVYGLAGGGNGIFDSNGDFTVTGGELLGIGTNSMMVLPTGDGVSVKTGDISDLADEKITVFKDDKAILDAVVPDGASTVIYAGVGTLKDSSGAEISTTMSEE